MTDALTAYGYVRLHDDTGEQELLLIEGQLRRYADKHNLQLVDTYYEEGPGISPQLLIQRLRRDGIRHVIVPSLKQITEHSPLRRQLARAITFDAGALLYEASAEVGRFPADGTTTQDEG